jgi:phosphate transport system ATP-binding protein
MAGKRIADYVTFIYRGELIEFGTADQLFIHPNHQLTQEYIRGGFS